MTCSFVLAILGGPASASIAGDDIQQLASIHSNRFTPDALAIATSARLKRASETLALSILNFTCLAPRNSD
jgi:hypothetical protein